jgi:hypothetical protein
MATSIDVTFAVFVGEDHVSVHDVDAPDWVFLPIRRGRCGGPRQPWKPGHAHVAGGMNR